MHLPLSLARARSWRGELAATRRRMGVAVLLGNTALMNFGFAMLVPLLAIHFTGSLGFTAAAIGLVLALRQFSQQGLDLVGGVFGDRFGARTAITIGCFVRAIGFLGIGFSRSLGPLILWAVVSGIGGAFFDASSTAALADLVEPHDRQRAFAASATLSSIGATVGPLLGVALLAVDFRAVSIAAASCFVLVGALTFALLPASALGHERPEDGAQHSSGNGSPSGVRRTLGILLADRTFLWMTVFLAGFWFLWAQINITVPLAAARLGGNRLAALAFAVNAGPAILLQYPLARYAGGRFSARLLLGASVALSGIGMALAFAAPGVTLFFAGVALFALARMLIMPIGNSVTAELAPADQLGAYFGFGALAVGVGAGFGQYAGGALYDAAQALNAPVLLWGTFMLVGAVAAFGLYRLALPDLPAQRTADSQTLDSRDADAVQEQPVG